MQTNRGSSAGHPREALFWGLFTTVVAAALVAVAGGGPVWAGLIGALGLVATGAVWFGLRESASGDSSADSSGDSGGAETSDDPGEDRHGA